MHKQPAQMLVEFAIMAPVLVALAMGILGFGRAFYSYIDMTNLARYGARYAASTAPACDQSDVQSKVWSAFQAEHSGQSNPTVGLTCITGSPASRKVDISYQFVTIDPFISITPITLSTSATLPVVNQ